MSARQLNLVGPIALSIFLTPAAWANMTGSASQNFNPSANASDSTTVRTADTLGQGIYSLGLTLNMAINSLPYYDANGEGSASRGNINDTLTSANMGIAAGVLQNLDLEVSFPATLFQTVGNNTDRHGQFAKRGFTGAAIAAKYAFYRSDLLSLALVTSVDFNLTDANPYDGRQRLNGYNAELVATTRLQLLTLSGNVGYRMRQPEAIAGDRDVASPGDDQWLASTGVSVPTPVTGLDAIAEIYGAAPLQKQFEANSRHSTKAEALAGVRMTNDNKIYQFGIGSELRHGSATADWRVYAGIHYLFGVKANNSPSSVDDIVDPAAVAVPDFLESDIDLLEKPDEVIVIDDILFKFNSDEIKDTALARKQLAELVRSLRKGDGFAKLIIEGHTCSIGTFAFNKKLSYKRALKIKSILTGDYGFRGARIKAKGMGESVPVATNNTETGRQRNRRVEFKIFRNSQPSSQLTLGGGAP